MTKVTGIRQKDTERFLVTLPAHVFEQLELHSFERGLRKSLIIQLMLEEKFGMSNAEVLQRVDELEPKRLADAEDDSDVEFGDGIVVEG